MGYVPRLKEKYKNEIVQNLKEEFKYSSVMQVPKLEKIAINQGSNMIRLGSTIFGKRSK